MTAQKRDGKKSHRVSLNLMAENIERNALLGGPADEKASQIRIPENHQDRGGIVKEQAGSLVLLILSSWVTLLILYGIFTEFDDEVLAGTKSGPGMSYLYCESVVEIFTCLALVFNLGKITVLILCRMFLCNICYLLRPQHRRHDFYRVFHPMIYQLNLIISMTEIISFAQIRIFDDVFTSLRLWGPW